MDFEEHLDKIRKDQEVNPLVMGIKEFEIDGKIYLYDEEFYQVYKSGKHLEELIEHLRNECGEAELDFGATMKIANEKLESKYTHYLWRYNKEKEMECK